MQHQHILHSVRTQMPKSPFIVAFWNSKLSFRVLFRNDAMVDLRLLEVCIELSPQGNIIPFRLWIEALLSTIDQLPFLDSF